jgi:hypothetical protein
MGRGGDIEEITISHPTIGKRSFAVEKGADNTLDLGGYSKEIEMNGNGTARASLERKPWMIENVSLNIEADNEDLEFLQNVQDSPIDSEFTFSYVVGDVYRGTGSLTGDLKHNTKSSLAAVTISGGGKCEKIA